MILSRKISIVVLVLSLLMLGSPPSWAGERLLYDDVWWQAQYAKIYDTPQCQEIITNTEKVRDAERPLKTLNAPFVWALGLYFAKGECADPDPDQALAILTDLAERGEGIAAVYLAHFHHIKHGANAPLTQSWMERAKHAMPFIIGENWRKDFYQPLADNFQKKGMPFSPQLERIFSWGEETLNGDPEPIYQIGMSLLENSQWPEAKVLGCNWIYEAANKGHAQARYRFARQMLLGDGVMQVPFDATLYLEIVVNRDHNTDAMIFVSQLLEKGDILRKDLSRSYAALLRAQILGANVAEADIERLRFKLTKNELYWAQKDAKNTEFPIHFTLATDVKNMKRSGPASKICVFVPQG